MTDGEYDRVAEPSVPLKFADGSTFQMSPLSDKDIAALDEWVRARVIQVARSSLTPELTTEERVETLEIAMRLAQQVTFISGEGASIMATVDGMTRLVWQCIKTNHPGVTEGDVRRHMFSPENIDEANRQFSRIHKLAAEPPKKGAKAEEARRRRAKLRKRKSTARSLGSTGGRPKRSQV